MPWHPQWEGDVMRLLPTNICGFDTQASRVLCAVFEMPVMVHNASQGRQSYMCETTRGKPHNIMWFLVPHINVNFIISSLNKYFRVCLFIVVACLILILKIDHIHNMVTIKVILILDCITFESFLIVQLISLFMLPYTDPNSLRNTLTCTTLSC